MLRERLLPPPGSFPEDPWVLENVQLDGGAEEFVGQAETMFALSNGYLGLRGTFYEGAPVAQAGVFLNGFYEYRPISYGEHAYGFPRRGQSMLNCPDGTIIRLFVDDEPFISTEAEVLSFRRALHLREGVETREITWRTQAGPRLELKTARFVSLSHRHLAAIRYELRALDSDTNVSISSEILHQQPLPADTSDPRLAVGSVGRVLEPAGSYCDRNRAVLSYVTLSSDLALACGMEHVLESSFPIASTATCEDNAASVVFTARLPPHQPLRLTKYLGYHYAKREAADQIRSQVGWTLDRAEQNGFEKLLARQRDDMSDFWSRADVEITSTDPRMQQVIRWNLFQLLQASSRSEGHGIGARGLTGQTYEGHYFWDTEIYVLPFLTYQEPQIARNLLKFRYDGLEQARARARELGHRGATFPWRTINGEEASAYYAAGTAQYHINADIAYAIRKYVEATGDFGFLQEYGAEILIETARFWWDIGFFSARRQGQFCINGVTGPDEYTAIVNNNYFTNLMARENLRYAAETVRWLRLEHADLLADLSCRTDLKGDEVSCWEEAADRMYLPYDEQVGVHPQDDSFLDKEVWDFAGTPEDKYPLLLHYHPLNLYRAQVIKQADILLAMFLLGDQFTLKEKKRNFDYYDPLTTHDSSLSVCIQSIIANEIGYREKAWDYFRFAAVMDLSDVGGNMKHGAHIASIGGTWLALIYGFAGMRDQRGRISFTPQLPTQWDAMRFSLMIRGSHLQVGITHEETTYLLKGGSSIEFHHLDEEVRLTSDSPSVRLKTPRPVAVEPVPEHCVADPKIKR